MCTRMGFLLCGLPCTDVYSAISMDRHWNIDKEKNGV